MRAAGRRRFIKNENNHSNTNSSQDSFSSTSDFSDNDDREKPKGAHRSNKSKLLTNIVPSFFDEILREIDESQKIDEKNDEADETPNIRNKNKIEDDLEENKENDLHNTQNQEQTLQLNQNVSSFLSDLNDIKTNNSSSSSKLGFINTPTFDSSTSKKSVATSPFKPKKQQQQKVPQELNLCEEKPYKNQQVQGTTNKQENKQENEVRKQKIQEQPVPQSNNPKKSNVTILYPKKSPQEQQRKQQQMELQQLAKQQEKQNKAKQLIQMNEQKRSIIKETKDDIPNEKIILRNPPNKISKQKGKVILDDSKKESQTVYMPPMYEKKLSSLFDIISSESDEPFTHDHIYFETSQAEMRDVFVFNTHEEGGRLYLFCKYLADPTQYGTICICVASPTLFLQFLPAFDMSDNKVEKEITEIAKLCKGEIISMKWLNKRSINSSSETKYLEVEFSARTNIADVPIKGKTYEAVYGSTLSLSEHLMIRKNLKGAKWISVRCSQASHRQTSIPMYTTLSPSDIEVTKGQITKPSMNICIFSIFERNGEVFMVSMRIFYQCNYESLDNYRGLNSARKSIITFIYAPEILKSTIKNDRTTMYCSTEAELLQNFADRIEQFDIDILCSYDLINHDLPFILDRMRINNMKQWTKFGRHFRTVFPKKESILSLITSGRMLLDLKSTFKNLLQIDSDNFSSLVQTELEIDRPILNFDSGSFCFTDQKQMQELISFNRKDTQFIKKILDNKNIISLSEHIARVTGYQWSQIMSEPPAPIIESLLLLYLHKKNYIIPDKKQQSDKYIFKPFEVKPGFYSSPTALISCDFFTAKVMQRKNLCFTTIDQIRPQKSNSIFPNMISELLNTYKKLNQVEVETEASQASILQKSLYKDSLNLILNLIKPYFEYGSQRFPISLLGQVVDDEIHKIINSFGNDVILVTGQNDFNSFIIEYEKENNNNDDNNLDEVDELISHANSGLKHFGFMVSEKYSHLLIPPSSSHGSASFLGIGKEGERKPHNFNFYRYDWCPATKILVDNAIRIVTSSIDAESDLVTLFNEFPDTSQLQPSDFAITTFPPSSRITSLFKEVSKKSKNGQNEVRKVTNLNVNKSSLRRVIDDSESEEEKTQRKFLSSSEIDFIDEDFDEIDFEPEEERPVNNEDRESFELNRQLVEMVKKYEEKGKFVNIEGKMTYVRCLENSVKSVEKVDSIDGQIDIEWYKKNQFYEAMKMTLKLFNSIISTGQITDAFLGNSSTIDDDDFVQFSSDNNSVQLIFSCFNCNQKNVFKGINKDCLKCQNCGIRFSWKYVANSLTFCIFKLIEKWSKNELKCNYFLCKQKREQTQLGCFQKHSDPCNPSCNCPSQFELEFAPKDVYEQLLALSDIFSGDDEIDVGENENELRMYMKQHISRMKDMHSFTTLKLSSLLSTQTQQSDTQIINDVCSFLDDE